MPVHTLNKVSVWDKTQEIVSYNLSYNDPTKNRKTLLGITKDKGIVQTPWYQFEYHPFPNRLPSSSNFKYQDAWGYYNGNASSLLSIENRIINYQKTLSGALKKIIYPTRGYSLINYEQNRVPSTSPGISDFYTYSRNKTISKRVKAGQGHRKTIDTIVTIPSNQIIEVNMGARMYLYDPNNPATTPNIGLQGAEASIEIACLDCINPSQLIGGVHITGEDTGAQCEATGCPSNYSKTNPVVFRSVSQGARIRIRGSIYAPVKREVQVNFSIKYEELINQVGERYSYVGGVRVRDTEDCDNNGNCKKTRYKYKLADGTESGILTGARPVYSYTTSYFDGINRSVLKTHTVSNSMRDFASYQGAPVLYKRVESIIETGENGKEVRHYSLATNNYTGFPFVTTLNNDWKKGHLLKLEVFKRKNGAFVLVRETTNQYEEFFPYGKGKFSSMKAYGMLVGKHYYSNTYGDPRHYNENYYIDYPKEYRLVETRTKEFLENKTMDRQSSYSYDTPYGQLKKQVTTDSQNNEISSTYLYPYDKAGAVNNALRHQNRISTAIEVSTARNDELLQTQSTEFKNWENGLLLPSYTKVAKGNKEAVVTLRYHRYDETGNPIEVSRENGSSQVLIWGYQNQLPVAKIENASYNDVAPYVANLKTASNADTDHCRQPGCKEQLLREALDNVREQLPDAMVTSYTYDPLIGVTSITDPRGNTIYHTYDAFSRLSYTEDHNGHVLQKYSYNYDGEKEAIYGAFSIAIDGETQVQLNSSIQYRASVTRSNASDRFIYTWWVDNVEVSCGAQSQINKAFNQVGNHQIRLKVVDTQTKEAKTVSKNIEVVYPVVQTPVVIASATYTIKGTPVVFTTTSGGGSGSFRYQWYVNNSLQDNTAARFDFSNSTAGTYSVYSKITDTKTGISKNSAIKKIYTYTPLSTSKVTTSETAVVQGTKVTYKVSELNGGSGDYNYKWYVNNSLQTINNPMLSYTHTTTGAFSVYVKVEDAKVVNHTKNSTTKELNVYNSLTTPKLISDYTHLEKGTTITFTASGINGGSGSRRNEWYINNTKQSDTGIKLVEVFSNTGTYTIKYRVIDTKISGHFKEKSKTIYVYTPLNRPTVSANKTHIIEGNSIRFTTNGIAGGSGHRTYKWYVNNQLQSATGVHFEKSFSTDGTYTIKFLVLDTKTGKSIERSRTIYVYNPLNTGAISVPSTTTVNNSASFNINSTGAGGSYTYTWTVKSNWKTHTSTSKSFNLKMNYDYYGTNIKVSCKVLEVKTGVSKTTSKTIIVNGAPPLGGSFSQETIHNNHYHQDYMIEAIVSNGSGHYSYTWYRDGAVVRNNPYGPQKIMVELNCDNKSDGLKCVIRDERTQKTKTIERSYNFTRSCNGGDIPH
ncbi:hypothetical protein [Aquimarina hainanensis]